MGHSLHLRSQTTLLTMLRIASFVLLAHPVHGLAQSLCSLVSWLKYPIMGTRCEHESSQLSSSLETGRVSNENENAYVPAKRVYSVNTYS